MFKICLFAIFILLLVSCESQKIPRQKCWDVTATAYNSVPYQTRPDSPGNIAAWGDVLVDSIPSIAISRDLLDSGLVHGTKVWIEGYTMSFVVNDKMNKRYTNRIDLHLGKNIKKAKKFGVKTLGICIEMPKLEDEKIELTEEIE